MFWKKGKQEKSRTFTAPEIIGIVNDVASKVELKEGETKPNVLPAQIGVREDFDPSHSFSCGSVRDQIRTWRLGAFMTTNMRLIFKRMEENGTFSTVLNIPLEKVYTFEVSGLDEKHLEICCDAGSFEFKGVGNDEGIYTFAEALQALCDSTRQVERETLFPTTSMTVCQYCGARNKWDATNCVHCGALIK